MPKLSIIVPVYRGEKVLPICVESIFAQTFDDWELLLIDDGSPDSSGALCDEFAAQDHRVRVFHKENGGVSSARNLGMAEALGSHILFVDADDWLDVHACAKLVKTLEDSGMDTAGCGHYNIWPNGVKETEPAALPTGVYHSEQCRQEVVARLMGRRIGKPGTVLNGFVWRFLFDRTLIVQHELRFSGAYLEDELFLLEYFCLAHGLAVLDEPLYYYLQNPNSVTKNFLPDYVPTFWRFLEAKQALAEEYHLGSLDPLWEESTCWAGLLIAIGNEYAPGNPASAKEKTRRIRALTKTEPMARAISTISPTGIGRNKQMVANLVQWRQFGLLSLLYQIKNRGR